MIAFWATSLQKCFSGMTTVSFLQHMCIKTRTYYFEACVSLSGGQLSLSALLDWYIKHLHLLRANSIKWSSKSEKMKHWKRERNSIPLDPIIIVVIITWPSEKPSQKKTLTSQLSGPLIRSNGLCLCKISSMVSQFSTNKRTISVFCCYLFAVFNNCWSTTPSFPSNSYTKLW